jgi:hypothetical protein
MERITDPVWLSECLGQRVARCTLDTGVDKLNKTSALRFASVEFEDGSSTTLVLKASEGVQNLSLGLAREALFYQWAKLQDDGAMPELPLSFFAEGSMETGAKVIIMQDLSSLVQCGFYFGNGNPNNWNKDLDICNKCPFSVPQLCRAAFSSAAKLHANYWGCKMRTSWLRGSGWLDGCNRSVWSANIDMAAQSWAKIKSAMGQSEVCWDPRLVAILDASLRKASPESGGWEAFQSELKARPYTLVHGDFHPANFMVRRGDDGQPSVVLMDWEMTGLGSGPQELGQFMISHTEPAIRSTIERDAVDTYYTELKSLKPDISMTLEECWQEYIAGGVGKWMWFLPWDFGGAAAQQFFHDQVLAFVLTHGVSAQNVPMPRI